MSSLDGWLGSNNLDIMSAAQRAVLAWRRIQDRSTSIVLHRSGTNQPAQTMRVEYDNSARWQDGELVAPSIHRLTLFGIHDHATLPDTDIQRGDRFTLTDHPGSIYEVISLLTPPGEVQAVCEGRQGS